MVQQPFQKALLTGKTKHAAWRSKPSFYAVSTEDRTINPDLERFMAKRMGAKTIEVEASHLLLISHPGDIANLILPAAGRSGLRFVTLVPLLALVLLGGLARWCYGLMVSRGAELRQSSTK